MKFVKITILSLMSSIIFNAPIATADNLSDPSGLPWCERNQDPIKDKCRFPGVGSGNLSKQFVPPVPPYPDDVAPSQGGCPNAIVNRCLISNSNFNFNSNSDSYSNFNSNSDSENDKTPYRGSGRIRNSKEGFTPTDDKGPNDGNDGPDASQGSGTRFSI